jgi:hypothetical protein
MSDYDRRLFIQFEAGQWTEDQAESLSETLGKFLPRDVGVVMIPDDIEYLTEDQFQDFVETVSEMAEDE